MNTATDKDKRSNSETTRTAPASERRIALNGNRLDSRDLFIDTREITIAHRDDVYRLRLTAQNKLILTK